MKKTLVILLSTVISLTMASLASADSGWDISTGISHGSGTFDYVLYYDREASQTLSKVILPQDQTLLVLNGSYHFPAHGRFINLQYGTTGTGVKGRGSDSDWTSPGSALLTDYGELDAYGGKKLFGIDVGTALLDTGSHKLTLSLGWEKQETTNELRNIVYHIVDGTDVGDQPQSDLGSTLNGEFSGWRLGLGEEAALTSNLSLNLGLTFSFLSAEAYGHWANHYPAWNWVDSGDTVGYLLSAGATYAFNDRLSGHLGYQYGYAKAKDCVEVLNGAQLEQAIDLKYEQSNIYAGLQYSF
jgi:opacity protein-like surface antigen